LKGRLSLPYALLGRCSHYLLTYILKNLLTKQINVSNPSQTISVVQWSLRLFLLFKLWIISTILKTILKRKIREKKRKETNHQRFESSILNMIHVECECTKSHSFYKDFGNPRLEIQQSYPADTLETHTLT